MEIYCRVALSSSIVLFFFFFFLFDSSFDPSFLKEGTKTQTHSGCETEFNFFFFFFFFFFVSESVQHVQQWPLFFPPFFSHRKLRPAAILRKRTPIVNWAKSSPHVHLCISSKEAENPSKKEKSDSRYHPFGKHNKQIHARVERLHGRQVSRWPAHPPPFTEVSMSCCHIKG